MIQLIHAHILPAALSLLPPEMDSPNARALLLAIGLQESRFQHRRQIGGPARGAWQFEYGGGILGVRTHPATDGHLSAALNKLCYAPDASQEALYKAIEHNDVLAAVMARLLLWTLPDALPGPQDAGKGYSQYLQAWRPGKPHSFTWPDNYRQAWDLVIPFAENTGSGV